MLNIEVHEEALQQAIDALRAQGGAQMSLASQEINTAERLGYEQRAIEYFATATMLHEMLPSTAGEPVYLALYGDPACTDEITLSTGRGVLGPMQPQVSADGRIELLNLNTIDMRVPEEDGRTVQGMAVVDSRGRIMQRSKQVEPSGPLLFARVSIETGKFALFMLGDDE